LLSKHRFVSAPFAAALRGGAWIRHASRANAMASRLARGLTGLGFDLRFPAQANGVFVVLADRVADALRARGHQFYMFGDPAWKLARLMCSFDTTESEVDAFVADARVAIEAR
jgi:threonine aldolase